MTTTDMHDGTVLRRALPAGLSGEPLARRTQRKDPHVPSPYRGLRLGTQFGPYQLRSLIGAGGMGEVHRAYDTRKGRMVALKLLRPELAADPGFRDRFRRESRLAARLQEPHVIPVHDFGEIDGVLFIDMRLVNGGSLKDLLRSGGPARTEARGGDHQPGGGSAGCRACRRAGAPRRQAGKRAAHPR